MSAIAHTELHRIADLRLFGIAGTPVTVTTLLIFLLILLATFLISRGLQRVVLGGLRHRGVADAGTLGVTRRLIHYVIVAVGLGVGLETIGIHLAALFAAGAVFAIGLGFAMQNIAQNFVAGVILLIERTIKPGDILHVGDHVVRVIRMGIRATIVRTRDGTELIVPNSTLVLSTVTNYTLRDSVYRLRAPVGVSYGADMARVRAVLEETARQVPWRYPDKAPLVLLTGFGDSSVDWEVSVWIDDPWNARVQLSALNEAIWSALQEAGIVIAFPQVDVHFDPPVIDAVRAVRGGPADGPPTVPARTAPRGR